MAGWKNPRRGVYRRVRLHFAQSILGHRLKCRMRFLLGPCGTSCAQIWPPGGQSRARGTFASLKTDGEISEVPRNTPFFHQLLGRNKHVPAFPSIIRACYGRCESLTTLQCQVVENEAWPQTDGSLRLPPVGDRPPSVYAYMPPLFFEPTPPGTPPGPRPPGRVQCSVSSGGVINCARAPACRKNGKR